MIGFIALALAALLMQYVSSTLGMGYGTVLAPSLIIAGFPVKEVVPAVVISQLAGNSLLPLLHHRAGNVDFGVGSRSTRVSIYLGFGGALGSFVAAALVPEVPEAFLKAYMAVLLTSLGLITALGLSAEKVRKDGEFRKLAFLSLAASFNKGLTGGGFGPLITAGQIILGHDVKKAIAITSFAELVAGSIASVVYVSSGLTNPSLIYPLTLGAVISAPLSTLTVKLSGKDQLRRGVGLGMVAMGLAMVTELLMSS